MPRPLNGSSTTSPGRDQRAMNAWARAAGKLARYEHIGWRVGPHSRCWSFHSGASASSGSPSGSSRASWPAGVAADRDASCGRRSGRRAGPSRRQPPCVARPLDLRVHPADPGGRGAEHSTTDSAGFGAGSEIGYGGRAEAGSTLSPSSRLCAEPPSAGGSKAVLWLPPGIGRRSRARPHRPVRLTGEEATRAHRDGPRCRSRPRPTARRRSSRAGVPRAPGYPSGRRATSP